VLDSGTLKRGRYAVLDRAPGTTPQVVDLHAAAKDFRLHYLSADYHWLDAWPPPQASDPTLLPFAVQWRIETPAYGEITGTVELVSAWPTQAAGAAFAPQPDATTPPVVPARPVLPPAPGGSR
jgi:general secretion pathway protein J